MSKLNYSNYTFFNANKKDNNNKEDIVEGIANFCKLNRSYNNQRHDLWRNLDAALNKEGQLKDDLLNANKANDGIIDANSSGDIWNIE